jgi:hypothetical protein
VHPIALEAMLLMIISPMITASIGIARAHAAISELIKMGFDLIKGEIKLHLFKIQA